MNQIQEMSNFIRRNMTGKAIEQEYLYFKEYARNFPNERRYGILKQGTKPSIKNMIYDEDVYNLRVKHLYHVAKNGGNDGQKVRKFIDWLEKAEGKQ